jgi:hypothetical protein
VTTVHYRYATVQARRLFYREAGPRGAPDMVLLSDMVLLHDYGAPIGWRLALVSPDTRYHFADDAPAAEIHLLDGGHFPLESHLEAAASSILRFLESALP